MEALLLVPPVSDQTSSEVDADRTLLPPTLAEPEPSWSLVRRLVSDTAHASHRQTLALWAIDRLEEHLGSDWARLAFDDEGLRQTLVWAGAHADATLFLLELALRLEQLKRTPGFAKARDQLRANVRNAVAGHTQLQLETAALSLDHGARVALEVTNPGLRNPVDLVKGLPRGEVTSDLWCREAPLEGCASCPGPFLESSGRT